MSIGPLRPQSALASNSLSPPSPSSSSASSSPAATRPIPERSRPGGSEAFIRVLSREGAPPGAVRPASVGGVDAAARRAASTPPTAAVAVTAAEHPAGIRAMAERALAAEKRVDALIAAAGSGRTFSAAELIALQATVFRYSQTVEVISRATDRLVGAIKQTLGTQV